VRFKLINFEPGGPPGILPAALLWGGAMNWKLELDALVESTMAFARDVERQPIPDLPVALRTAEQMLADTSKPIPFPANFTPMTWAASERDEIRQRVNNFKAHKRDPGARGLLPANQSQDEGADGVH
jgi:hypothetical protein